MGRAVRRTRGCVGINLAQNVFRNLRVARSPNGDAPTRTHCTRALMHHRHHRQSRTFSIVTSSRTIRVLMRCSATDTNRMHGCTCHECSVKPPTTARTCARTGKPARSNVRVAGSKKTSRPVTTSKAAAVSIKSATTCHRRAVPHRRQHEQHGTRGSRAPRRCRTSTES